MPRTIALRVVAWLIAVLALGTGCNNNGMPTANRKLERTAQQQQALDEIDTTSDPANCGAIGYQCVGGRTCSSSRCTPAWLPMSTQGAPAARSQHAAGARSGKYVVFGGCTQLPDEFLPIPVAAERNGGQYDPATDTWSNMPNMVSRRAQHAAVTTPTGIYTFGGITFCWDGTAVGPGFEQFAASDTDWQVVPAGLSISARYDAQLIWTGWEVLTFGGATDLLPHVLDGARVALGGPWNPLAACPFQECDTSDSFAIFYDNGAGRGGQNGNFFTGGIADPTPGTGVFHSFGPIYQGSGQELVYDLGTNQWRYQMLPDGAIWDWTGIDKQYADDGRQMYYLKDNGTVITYDRWNQMSWFDPAQQPAGLCPDAAKAWVGTQMAGEMIAWGGYCNGSFSSVGGRYQPAAPLSTD